MAHPMCYCQHVASIGFDWMLWLWLALTAGVMITSYITMARGDKRPPRALLEAIVANLIFGALLLLVSRYPPRTAQGEPQYLRSIIH